MKALKVLFITLLLVPFQKASALGEIFGDGTNNMFVTFQSGNLGFFSMQMDSDHYYGQKSVSFQMTAWQNATVEITKNLGQPVQRGNYMQCMQISKFLQLDPPVSNVYIKTTFFISYDGTNFCLVGAADMGRLEIGNYWFPILMPIQGQNPPVTVTAIRMRFELYFEGNPASDSIKSLIKWDYWVFSNDGIPGPIIEEFEGVINGIHNQNQIAEKFQLGQNYPNPFNPKTNIEFSIPKQEFVKLAVYDALGREIETLVDEKLNMGTYKIDWNASNFSSGVYFYRIETTDFSDTKKMILVK